MQKGHGLGFSQASQAAVGQSAAYLILRGCGMSFSCKGLMSLPDKCQSGKGFKEAEIHALPDVQQAFPHLSCKLGCRCSLWHARADVLEGWPCCSLTRGNNACLHASGGALQHCWWRSTPPRRAAGQQGLVTLDVCPLPTYVHVRAAAHQLERNTNRCATQGGEASFIWTQMILLS